MLSRRYSPNADMNMSTSALEVSERGYLEVMTKESGKNGQSLLRWCKIITEYLG